MDKGTALLHLLKDIAALGKKITASYGPADKVLWFFEVPSGRPECRSPFLAEASGEQGDFWLEVRKTPQPTRAPHPNVLNDWLRPEDLECAGRKPQLLPEINVLVERPAGATGGDGHPDPDEEKLPERHLLRDHPEVEEAWVTYFVEEWEPWSTRMLRWQSSHRVYEDVDFMRRRLEEAEERFELLLAVGLVQWRDSGGNTVKRHLLTAPAEIELDAARGILTVVPSATFETFKVELDMLEFHDQPRLDGSPVEELLMELDSRAWESEPVTEILREIANRQPNAQVDGQRREPLPTADNVFRVVYAPALTLRERRPTAFSEVIARLLDSSDGGTATDAAQTTAPWEYFLAEGDGVTNGAGGNSGDEAREPSDWDERVLFPLPTNEQQLQIIERLHSRPFVIVKGPPGTGKSLTIANLICHLLARGDRVLVTAHAAKALDVLRGLLPEEVRALCVTTLGSSRDDQRLLEEGVRGILRRHNEWPGQKWAEQRVETLETELTKFRSQQAETRRCMRECREAEVHPHVLPGGYEGTAANIARAVENDREKFSWFPDTPAAHSTNPLSAADISAIADLHGTLTADRCAELSMDLGADLSLPDPVEFRRACEDLAAAEEAARQASSVLGGEAPAPIAVLADDALRKTAGTLHSMDSAVARAERVFRAGVSELLVDLLVGRLTKWQDIHSNAEGLLRTAEAERATLGSARVETPPDGDEARLLSDAERRLAHLESGGSQGFLIFAPRVVWETRVVRNRCTVDGAHVVEVKQLQQLVAYLRLRKCSQDLGELWPAAFTKPPLDPLKLPSILRESLHELGGLIPLLSSPSESLPAVPVANRASLAEARERERWRLAVDAEVLRHAADSARGLVQEVHEKLRARIASARSHPCLGSLMASVEAQDPAPWQAAWAAREAVLLNQKRFHRYEAMLTKLAPVAPRLASTIRERQGDPTWTSFIRELNRAWNWAAAAAWLKRTFDTGVHRDLDHTSHRLDNEIEKTVKALAATEAWRAFLNRLDEKTVQSLNAWTRALDRVGKGTGKYAYRHRRAARRYLMDCIPTIPAWIMPLHKVWDTIDAKPGLFDTVIVDEASQAGIQSLVLLLLGKRVIVVGDDKQNSPEAVGILEDDIARLARIHLQDFRFRDEYRPDSSLFDHAERAFGNMVSLREHFRCVPEIIQFSNDLCYQDAPLIPLRQAPPNRLPPLTARFVPGGSCEGDGQRIHNEAEAAAIVKAVVGCINDDEYDGKTMGIIVLQGQAQVELIRRRLAEALDPRVIHERKLRCGLPSSFQGDERHVVFLSLVMSPDRQSRALTGLADQRRFNVAMSRGRDQVWLFHSIQQHDLSPLCLRRRLLGFFQNARRETASRLLEERDRLERESRRTQRAPGNQPSPYDSWFEVDVALELLNRGYQLRPQVETAGKRIDLVIEYGETTLAVECDGDAWHGPDQYEQDMARERLLQRAANWTFVRVKEWEFYSDRAKAIAEVVQTCKDLGIRSLHDPVETVEEEPEPREPRRAKPVHEVAVRPARDAEEPEVHAEAATPNGEASMDTGPFSGYSSTLGFPDPRTASPQSLKAALRQVIERDGPLTRASAYRLYIEASPHLQRAGKAVRQALNRALGAMLRAGEIVQDDELGDGSAEGLVLRLTGTSAVRERPAGRRDLIEVPPSELLLLVERIASRLNPSEDDEEVCRRLLDHLGYTRLTTVRRKHLQRILELSRRRVE